MLPMRDGRTDVRTNEQGKIELLSQWKLEAEFRNNGFGEDGKQILLFVMARFEIC